MGRGYKSVGRVEIFIHIPVVKVQEVTRRLEFGNKGRVWEWVG